MAQRLTHSTSQTIENTREKDETIIAPDDAEVQEEEADDEFAGRRRPLSFFQTLAAALSALHL